MDLRRKELPKREAMLLFFSLSVGERGESGELGDAESSGCRFPGTMPSMQ